MIKLDPPYKHLFQKPAFCGPCCVQMILFRRGVRIDQEEIALELNAGILEKENYHYTLSHKIVDGTDEKDIGTSFEGFDAHLNKLFQKRNLALQAKLYHLNQISNHKEFVHQNIEENNDIIVNFWLRQVKPRKIEVGHYVLISEVNTNTNVVTICDPDGDSKGSWKIRIDELLNLTNTDWDGSERGFIVIKG